MAIRVKPTRADQAVAGTIARHTNRPAESVAKLMTWGADEHLLNAIAAIWWVGSRTGNAAKRRAADHLLLTTLAASLLPHVLKMYFDQIRPDRLTIQGHLHGVPLSGKQWDAFPSGHAIHVGALCSAASVLPKRQRHLAWTAGALLVSTRVILLAHWASDVMVGVSVGIGLERLLRRFTGFARR